MLAMYINFEFGFFLRLTGTKIFDCALIGYHQTKQTKNKQENKQTKILKANYYTNHILRYFKMA